MVSQHERLERLFDEALRTPPEGRSSFLAQACADDELLRQAVEGLLTAHEQAGTFLATPVVDVDATIAAEGRAAEDDGAVGSRIGPYHLLELIGEGGFGRVYLAEQEEPVCRKVALKIIKLGMDTRQVIARFEAERQALALMDHANIARVLDAGATGTGRPYFVMELVRGVPLTEYADKYRLSIEARLSLFLPVCHAVQHAHQKGVIHRDLKPSNVLVTQQEDQPVPKIIDFGIAKAMHRRLTEKTLFTGIRQFIGTPAYISPEQAEGGGLDVDTRTDVYSLGVLLYEMLTGTTPLDAHTLHSAGYDGMQRMIRESEPPRPAARVRTLIQNGAEIAWVRRSVPTALMRRLRGDLDSIVMKAIEKDRTHRYATAKDLADDLERHLRHEPVQARPPSVADKLRKFARRHRAGVVAGGLISFALVAGCLLAVAGLVQARRAQTVMKQERDAARAARADAEHARLGERLQRERAEATALEAVQAARKSATVSRFLQEMLSAVDPQRALGRQVTVRYVLDEAARRIKEGALAAEPAVEAVVRMTLGETYEALGEYDQAEAHVQAARTRLAELVGPAHPDTLVADRAAARLQRARGRFTAAEALLRATAETQRQVLGEEHLETLTTLNELALALWGPRRFAEAEALHRRILEIQQRVLGERHIETVKSLGYLGAVCRELGRLDEAEQLLQRALELSTQVVGEQHPNTASVLSQLGLLREAQRDYAQAEALLGRAHELDRRILGADHPRTLVSLNDLVRVLEAEGKTAELADMLALRLAHLERAASRPDASALMLHAYAWELLNCRVPALRAPQTALPLAQRAVELDGGRDANLLETLALAWQQTGDLARAVAVQREAVQRARSGGPYDAEEMETRLVDLLMAKGDLAGAAAVSWEGLAAQIGAALAPAAVLDQAWVGESEQLMADGRHEDAAALLRGTLAMLQKRLPADHWLLAEASSRLGGALVAAGQFAEAEALLLDSHQRLSGEARAPAESRRQALERIVELYERWGKTDQAEAWRAYGRKPLPAEKAAGEAP
ncbi:MAG: tetratricopeptide repeat protein [Planctomycetota bacterium]